MAANGLTCGEHWVKCEKQWMNVQLSFFLLFLKHYHSVHEKCGLVLINAQQPPSRCDWGPYVYDMRLPGLKPSSYTVNAG